MPLLEYVLCAEPFHWYFDFVEERSMAAWCEQAPLIVTSYKKGIVRSGQGVQAGHLFSA